MKRMIVLALFPMLTLGCTMSASTSSPNGGGAAAGTNPDRAVGSASVSVSSPDGGGAVAGTPASTTQPHQP